ncbi:MAG: hypothetical protein JSU01_02895 [Bacteroidetes bacterium]|nr:hypothetical protein [Bacteroidota bacterium]
MKLYKTIAIIICFYGKFPWFFKYFLESCRYNETVDFYIITDNPLVNNLPANVRFVNKTLNEISRIATEKIGIDISIINPYKLCDFKPTYGLLFHDLVSNYDFWGYGDIDVIFGDIRGFISPKVLEHDIISVRHDFLTGYFQLFRNDIKMINLFTHSKDHIKVLESARCFCFDETNYCFDQFSQKLPLNEINSEIESLMHVVRRLDNEKYIKAYFDFHVIEGLPGKLRWDKGRLFYKNKFEVILYHLILLKRKYKPRPSLKPVPSSFNISPSRIYYKNIKV